MAAQLNPTALAYAMRSFQQAAIDNKDNDGIFLSSVLADTIVAFMTAVPAGEPILTLENDGVRHEIRTQSRRMFGGESLKQDFVKTDNAGRVFERTPAQPIEVGTVVYPDVDMDIAWKVKEIDNSYNTVILKSTLDHRELPFATHKVMGMRRVPLKQPKTQPASDTATAVPSQEVV